MTTKTSNRNNPQNMASNSMITRNSMSVSANVGVGVASCVTRVKIFQDDITMNG